MLNKKLFMKGVRIANIVHFSVALVSLGNFACGLPLRIYFNDGRPMPRDVVVPEWLGSFGLVDQRTLDNVWKANAWEVRWSFGAVRLLRMMRARAEEYFYKE